MVNTIQKAKFIGKNRPMKRKLYGKNMSYASFGKVT